MDKCLILWAPDEASGIWLERARMGEVGGQAAGYFGAVYTPDGRSILGQSFHGGLHLWTWDEEKHNWNPRPAPSGHFGAVEDLRWDPNGRYLISCSDDQTTRIFAPWRMNGEQWVSYHEIGRPQVHGHDMKCLAVIDE